jgi:hypothetical protein
VKRGIVKKSWMKYSTLQVEKEVKEILFGDS